MKFLSLLLLMTPVFAEASPQQVNIEIMQGMFMPASIAVTQNQPVHLVLKSDDGAHGISIPDFNFTLEVEAGKTAAGDFTPNKTGTFQFFDTHDSQTKGNVLVR